ncbi:cytochrome b/b6 domain-containing protein [Photobacterium sp. MCCC 1A19761]|uniref:cytochrome b/b6 domain-containing protein n=1 Tax=Photobacterium sp. MCCC 1A19761 TaxID=3115000 RepID=UPI00307F200F
MIKVWDLPTRIYHWLQALLVAGLLGTGLNGGGSSLVHQILGLMILLLLIWRVGWGLAGSETSRFANFVRPIGPILAYLKGQGTPFVGHNPLGGLMVVAMIALLLVQSVTGLMNSELIDGVGMFGRSAVRQAEQIHAVAAEGIIAFVMLHLVAIAGYRLFGKGLLLAMITGRAKGNRQPKLESHRKAALVFVASCGLVLAPVVLLMI